jgi:hypothetical protein
MAETNLLTARDLDFEPLLPTKNADQCDQTTRSRYLQTIRMGSSMRIRHSRARLLEIGGTKTCKLSNLRHGISILNLFYEPKTQINATKQPEAGVSRRFVWVHLGESVALKVDSMSIQGNGQSCKQFQILCFRRAPRHCVGPGPRMLGARGLEIVIGN